jgi:3-phenylpropionate/cinnamic acid dioxygenase small subunit
VNSVETITAMVYRYCELFDSGDFDGYVKQFEHGRMGGREKGSESLRQWITDNIMLYDGMPYTKHLTTNLIVEVDEESGTAKARSYVTLLQAPPGQPLTIVGCAEYHDQFERVDGTWRWAERKVVNRLDGDSSGHIRSRPT